jgi:alginate O-acetyltransferase complex protein AlgI
MPYFALDVVARLPYVSLGGNRAAPWRVRVNLMITMLLGGLWHGAALHFIA